MGFAFRDFPKLSVNGDQVLLELCVTILQSQQNSESKHLFISIRSQFLKCWLTVDGRPERSPVTIMDSLGLRGLHQGSAAPSQLKTSSPASWQCPSLLPRHMTQHLLEGELGQRCWVRLQCEPGRAMGTPGSVQAWYRFVSAPIPRSLVKGSNFQSCLGRRGICMDATAVGK